MTTTCTACEHVMCRDDEPTMIHGQTLCLDCVSIARPLKDRDDIRRLVEFLKPRSWIWHWHDNPLDIAVWMSDCGREVDAPTEHQIDMIDARIREAMDLDEDYLWEISFDIEG